MESELSKPYSSFLVYTDDETDTEIAGYIIFWTMFDECQILNLGVDISFRGLGIAQKLVRQAVQQAISKNIRKVLLDVRKSNQPAILLYQKVGFVIIHVRKSFYSNGEDAYQMALYLNQDAPTEF
jgi:ribosomal-protein-alanine N-acetyltransferase